jgi:hypothetical protein
MHSPQSIDHLEILASFALVLLLLFVQDVRHILSSSSRVVGSAC